MYCYLKSEIDDESLDYLLDSEGLSNLNDSNISFESNFTPSEIFYIDNISVLDLRFGYPESWLYHHIKEDLEEENTHCSSEIYLKSKIS